MKLSVSLPREDVEFVDDYLSRSSITSRSAALHQAIGLLRQAALEEEYVSAWEEWDASEDAQLWAATVGDGVVDAPR